MPVGLILWNWGGGDFFESVEREATGNRILFDSHPCWVVSQKDSTHMPRQSDAGRWPIHSPVRTGSMNHVSL